ncbi:MAG: adenylate/guanylate cyclase domain-containing protein [Candidatus Muiribacteriota bacterium]
MKKQKSKNLSVMFTDIQGYTTTSSAFSREEIIELIKRHNKLMQPIINFYGGNIIKTIGDSFLVTFESATDAVVCGIVIQLILNEYNNNQPVEEKKLNLRVVINTGDVAIEDNDVFGEGVNIAARMEGLDCFDGGKVGISQSTNLLINRNEIFTEEIGSFKLKGVPYKVKVYNVPLYKQNIVNIPIKLMKIAEKMTATRKGFDESFKEWNNYVKKFIDEDMSSKVSDFKKDISEKTNTILEEIKAKKETFGSEIKDEIYKEGKELKKEFVKGINKINELLNRKDEE